MADTKKGTSSPNDIHNVLSLLKCARELVDRHAIDQLYLRVLEDCVASLEKTYGKTRPGQAVLWQTPSFEGFLRLIDYLAAELEVMGEEKLSRDLRACFGKLVDTLKISPVDSTHATLWPCIEQVDHALHSFSFSIGKCVHFDQRPHPSGRTLFCRPRTTPTLDLRCR